MARVLITDQEVTMVQMVTEVLRSEGHEVFPFANCTAARAALSRVAPDVVITGLSGERTSGRDVDTLQQASALNPPAVVIVVTSCGSLEMAVRALKSGAFDYLEKPFAIEELKLCVQRALCYHAAVSENALLRSQIERRYRLHQIVGTSPALCAALEMIERAADSDETVLIRGPKGVGKELVARTIHFNSRRRYGRFVRIDCKSWGSDRSKENSPSSGPEVLSEA
jgi:DNA-binding NtrC family response regulator